MASGDSDEDWAEELITAHRPDIRDERWLRELVTAHRPTSGHSVPGRTDEARTPCPPQPPAQPHSQDQFCYHSQHILPVAHTASSSSRPPLQSGRLPFELVRSGKRRRSTPAPLLEPITTLVAYSLRHQHAQLMALCGPVPQIQKSLLRSWISATAKELAPASLEVLSNSLAERVRGIVSSPPCIFKVGLTRDPLWRWRDAPFAYANDVDFAFMELLLVGSTGLVAHLEAALIARLRSQPGCRNDAPGGESPPPPSYPCYLYVVWQQVSSYIAHRLHLARRAEQLSKNTDSAPPID